MMDELISREALVREVIGLTIVSPEVMNYANAVAVAIENAPIVDAEPVRHGHWIKSKTKKLYFEYGMEGYYDYPELCSVCHYDATENECGVGNYCSNCGAKMDGGKES